MIPHRYPFLLVDRLVDVRQGHSAVGIKNVTVNEPFFQGHFPGHPVMPGVLIIEAWRRRPPGLVISHPWARGRHADRLFHVDRECEIPQAGHAGRPVATDRDQGSPPRQCLAFQRGGRVEGVVVAEAAITAMIMDEVKPRLNPRIHVVRFDCVRETFRNND